MKWGEYIVPVTTCMFLGSYLFHLGYFFEITGYRFTNYVTFADIVNFTVSPVSIFLVTIFFIGLHKAPVEVQDFGQRIKSLNFMLLCGTFCAGVSVYSCTKELTIFWFAVPFMIFLLGANAYLSKMRSSVQVDASLFQAISMVIFTAMWSPIAGLITFGYNFSVDTVVHYAELENINKKTLHAAVLLEKGVIGLDEKKDVLFIPTGQIIKITEN